MININKRMYLTNQHTYVLSNRQDTGSMNIKGHHWENNKIVKHFDGTSNDNTAIVFKNLTKTFNVKTVNINLMQFNTFSTQVDLRSLSISINENSKGKLNVVYGEGYNCYTDTLCSHLPNSLETPEDGKHLEIENKFSENEEPMFGTITFDPKYTSDSSMKMDSHSFRGIVTLKYKIANKLTVSETFATCKIYFLPYTSIKILSIDGENQFIHNKNEYIYPNPVKLPSPSIKLESTEDKYLIPISFTSSFGINDENTYVDNNITIHEPTIINFINNSLTTHVNIPNNFKFMAFTNNNFQLHWTKEKNTQELNVSTDKTIFAGKFIIRSNTNICTTNNDISLCITLDNNKNIGYVKTIYSDVAPLTKVITFVNPTDSFLNINLLSPDNNNSQLNFNQTITVIVKNQSNKNINIKVCNDSENHQDDCAESNNSCDSNLYDSNLYDSSLYDNNLYDNNLYDNNLYDNDECGTHTTSESENRCIKPGNYIVFERVLFTPTIWESSCQAKITIIRQHKKSKCCK